MSAADDIGLYAELLQRLNMDGCTASEAPEGLGILIREWEDKDMAPPLLLHVEPTGLARHMRSMDDDARAVFPSAGPLIGALQLFLVHIDEAIATRDEGDHHLVISRSGVRAQSDPPT